MKPERIEDILAFVRAADTRSFTVAARQLEVSRSTVGKRITRLEERLGVRLLHRTTRSVTLTGEGALFNERCLEVLQSLHAAEQAMTAGKVAPSGTLRLAVPVSLGRAQVVPVAEAYLARWPGVSVNIDFSDRFVDLVDEGFDLAIRVGGTAAGGLVARRVAPHRLVTCAAPAYLERRGVPAAVADLAAHGCLAYCHAGRVGAWQFGGPVRTFDASAHARFLSSNAAALRDAAVAGLGVGQLATFLVADDLRAGRLVPLLSDLAVDGEAIHVLYPTRHFVPTKVRAFIDLLTERWGTVPPWDR